MEYRVTVEVFSPRRRGWSFTEDAQQLERGVLPAQAGVVRRIRHLPR